MKLCASVCITATVVCAAVAGEIPWKKLCDGTDAVYGIQKAKSVPELVLARDENEMRRIWAEDVTGSAGAMKNPPAVNWKKECVITVFIGARPTSGYAVQVNKVTLTDSAVEVGIEERKPPPDSMVAQVISSPYCAVTCSRANFPLEKILVLRLIGEGGKVLLECPAWSYRFMDVSPGAESQKGRK